MMTINEWLALAGAQLRQAGIESARLDSLLLLEDCLNIERGHILAHPDAELTTSQQALLRTKLDRRVDYEPMAYIRGHSEFYGRSFEVNNDMLVPRPESESMIELLLKLSPVKAKVADIGTGSGCLAITAAVETDAVVCAVDIDEACLAVAKQNAVVHTAQVHFQTGSLIEPFLPSRAAEQFSPNVLLANLPYVPNDFPINQAAKYEPKLALFGGDDGLDLYRQLFAQTTELTTAPQLVITEALLEQHNALRTIAEQYGYKLAETNGLAQAFTLV